MALNIAEGDLYRITYVKKGYECEEFIYKEDLIDTLSKFTEKGIAVLKIAVED